MPPWLLWVAVSAWLSGCGSDASTPLQATSGEGVRARNALLITVDTLRTDALGFSGNPRAATPTLDRLAAQGRVHTTAHAHNVTTLPSHANILTGLYPYQHGVRDNSGYVLPASVPTAATLLQEAGLATAAFVGAFPLDARFGLFRGFDVYDDLLPEGSSAAEFAISERRGDEVVAGAQQWWRDHRGESRFLWIHLFDPHAPYAPPEPFASRFPGRPYLGEAAAVDAFLAPLLAPFLEGREESTLIVFTSDHGESLGDHGELTHGLFAYEATLKVPLVVWANGLERGTSHRPARHVDILPTLLEVLDVPAPVGLPGRSLLAPGEGEPDPTYFEALSANLNRGWAPLRGVIHDGYKLISLPLPELYNLRQDPGEQRNLASLEPDRLESLTALLPVASAGSARRGEISNQEAAALRRLGYLSGDNSRTAAEFDAEDDPKTLVELDRSIHRFIELYQLRRLAEATALARDIVRQRPQMGVSYYHLAQVLLEQGRVQEAVSVMTTAVDLEVATAPLIRQLGLSLAELGRATEAVALLEPLAATGEPDALNALGLVLSEAGRQPEARATLLRIAERDPRNPEAHENLALVAVRSRQWSEAKLQAQRALELNQSLPLAWNYLGVALYNLGQPREALTAWEKALALRPDDYDILYNMAVIAAETGDAARARAALARFIASAPAERYGSDLVKARRLLRRLEAKQ